MHTATVGRNIQPTSWKRHMYQEMAFLPPLWIIRYYCVKGSRCRFRKTNNYKKKHFPCYPGLKQQINYQQTRCRHVINLRTNDMCSARMGTKMLFPLHFENGASPGQKTSLKKYRRFETTNKLPAGKRRMKFLLGLWKKPMVWSFPQTQKNKENMVHITEVLKQPT